MSTFLLTIISRTPVWVWVLLAGLIVLGLAQLREREVTRRRVIILPVVLGVLSLSGVAGAFGLHAAVEGPWLLGVLLGLALTRVFPPAGRVQALPEGRLLLGGSALPLVTMMAVFFMRYAVNVSLAVVPALAQQTLFGAGAALLYGLPAGLMAGRALRILGSAAVARPALA
ncbi:hypothetical protein HLB44_17755 [Aquincola sp. S2]|uniref:Tat pathway signal sequence n=1 Tax=Pseudaquabacterium terrae TaxID=2732868 RepID=A0ABX2EJL8_9BURK|nr:DUF6622 family protein [Aquabacterium terrae]NRF68841.1 hypothetical protein [Aquabacterium terrae]